MNAPTGHGVVARADVHTRVDGQGHQGALHPSVDALLQYVARAPATDAADQIARPGI